jgi:hypothetical protein
MQQVGKHYDLGMISVKNAIQPQITLGNIKWRDYSSDYTHPNTAAHAFIAEMISNYFAQAAVTPAEPWTMPETTRYGKAWEALGILWPRIDDVMTIKKRDIQIQCDFEGSETLVNARVDITITLARIFGLVFGYGARLLWGYLKIMNNRKKAAEAEKKRRKKIINTRYQ